MSQYKVKATIEIQFVSDDDWWPEGDRQDLHRKALDEDCEYLFTVLEDADITVTAVQIEEL